jgi:hypothetical protein
MRRVLGLVIAAAFAAAVSGGAGAESGPGPGNGSPPYPFVVGAGSFVSPALGVPEHVTLSAHLGPNGPSGHYTINFGAGDLFTGEVQCMKVVGDRAAAGGPLREPIVIGGILIENAAVFVEDNGEGGLVPDRAGGSLLLPTTFERLCDPITPVTLVLPTAPLESGNFVVSPG